MFYFMGLLFSNVFKPSSYALDAASGVKAIVTDGAVAK
jgi:hypothetical protein